VRFGSKLISSMDVRLVHRHELSVPLVRFQVLTAVSMKMTVFWDVAPCSLVEVYLRFRGAYCFRHHRPDDGDSKHL
jgi:hypothetical protein